jgi:hypothetical protein
MSNHAVNQKAATIILAVAALAVVLVILFLPGAPPPAPAAKPENSPAPSKPHSTDSSPEITSPAQTSATSPGGASLPPGKAWEDRLDELLTTEADNATTVRGLVSSMRGLPAEAQEEFIAHAVNLCEDEQFELLANIYLNPATPKEVSETIFNDLLNRPDEIKLLLLAKTLGNTAHPMNAEAREILEMYLDLEPGAVPPKGWEQAANDYIKQQSAP